MEEVAAEVVLDHEIAFVDVEHGRKPVEVLEDGALPVVDDLRRSTGS